MIEIDTTETVSALKSDEVAALRKCIRALKDQVTTLVVTIDQDDFMKCRDDVYQLGLRAYEEEREANRLALHRKDIDRAIYNLENMCLVLTNE